MKKYQLLLIACITGVLLSLAWPTYGFSPLLLIAFVPLLWVEDYISKNLSRFAKFTVFTYSFFAFLIWNIITTYWISYSTLFGLFAPVINALLGATVFQTYHFSKRVIFKNKNGFLLLPIFWITMEYIHHQWELSWPWMSLGNGFSTMPMIIQWYEYTGMFGGSLWVFIANYFAIKIIMKVSIDSKFKIKIIDKKLFTLNSSLLTAIIAIPIIISLIIWNNYKDEPNKPIDVVVLQPNLEPYDESLMLSNYEIIDLITSMASQKTDNNTSFILCPEGCLEERIWENDINNNYSLKTLSQFVSNYDKAQLIIGSFTRKLQSEEEKDEVSRPIQDAPKPYYSVYNSAIHIKSGDSFEVYHKSKLVPGVERMPFTKYISKVLDYAIALGNLPVGSLGIDNQHGLFISESSGVKVTPPICYESIYGGLIGDRVREGAELIFIITNDSWWKDSQGHKQHASYASLRAIETRRYIARSANTGTSCFVNPRGEISQKTKFFTEDVIKASLVPQKRLTFYVKHGDYIAKASVFASILLLIISYANMILIKLKKK
ncbi:MAG: lnt [Bacteroidetes bacterium]|nr:lnt [Bacteroidota bacterium]